MRSSIVAGINFFADDQAVVIDGEGGGVGALDREDIACIRVTRIFDTDDGAFAYQQAREQIKRRAERRERGDTGSRESYSIRD